MVKLYIIQIYHVFDIFHLYISIVHALTAHNMVYRRFPVRV